MRWTAIPICMEVIRLAIRKLLAKPLIVIATLALVGGGSSATDLEAYLRAASLPPLQDDFPKVIAEGKTYTVHRVIEPYFDYLMKLSILSESDTFRDDLYVLIVNPETGLPVADIQTLRQAIFAYFDARSLAIGNSSRWKEQSNDIFWLSQVKHPLQWGIAGLAQALSSVAGGLTLTLLTGGAGSEIAAAKVMGDLSKAVLSEALGYLLDFTPVEALRRVTFECLNEAKAAYDAAISLQNRLTYGEPLSADEVLACYHTLSVWERVYNDLVLLDNEIWSGFANETAGSCVWNATLSFAVSGAGKIKTLTESEIGKAVAQLTEQEKFALKYSLNYMLKSVVFEDLELHISTSREAFASLGWAEYPREVAKFISRANVLAQIAFWVPELEVAFDHFGPLLNSMVYAIEEIAERKSILERIRPSKVAFAVQGALQEHTLQKDVVEARSAQQWTKIWSGAEDDCTESFGTCVQETSDGGYVIVGGCNLLGEYVIWLIRTDWQGEKLWQRFFGRNDSDSVACSVEETADGGYIIVGETGSWDWGNLGATDIWLIKTDGEGRIAWERTFGGDEGNSGYVVHETTEGGYIILGEKWFVNEARDAYTDIDVWLLKTEAYGDRLWDKTFGSPRDDQAAFVQQTIDGGYIIAGQTESHSEYEDSGSAWLIKTDVQGNMVWSKMYGDPYITQVWSGTLTFDGGYLIAGTSSSHNGYDDVWLLKTDAQGNPLWERTFDNLETDQARHVEQTLDGGFAVLAMSFDEDWDYHVWLFKTDIQGNLLWNKTFGGPEQQPHGQFLKPTGDGGYVIVGDISPSDFSRTDLWLVKTDAQGNTE